MVPQRLAEKTLETEPVERGRFMLPTILLYEKPVWRRLLESVENPEGLKMVSSLLF